MCRTACYRDSITRVASVDLCMLKGCARQLGVGAGAGTELELDLCPEHTHKSGMVISFRQTTCRQVAAIRYGLSSWSKRNKELGKLRKMYANLLATRQRSELEEGATSGIGELEGGWRQQQFISISCNCNRQLATWTCVVTADNAKCECDADILAQLQVASCALQVKSCEFRVAARQLL